MEAESFEMLSKKCRLCGEQENFSSDIFGEEAKLRELPRKMETCLPIKITTNSNFPNKICYRCIYKVEHFFDFYNQVEKTNNNFENMLKNSIVESKSLDISDDKENSDRLILVDKFTTTEDFECEICKSKLGHIKQHRVTNKLVDYDSDSKSNSDERLRNNFTENHSTYKNILTEISLKKNQKRTIDSIFNALGTKKQKVSNHVDNVVYPDVIQSIPSRRKSKQPKKITEKSVEQTCLLCDLKFESHELLVKHLYECHELEPKEIFDPKLISETNAQYSKEISNVIRITERLKSFEPRLRLKDDISDESDTEVNNRFEFPQIPVQVDLEAFAEQLWTERQYFMESTQMILTNQQRQRGPYVCQICARNFHDKSGIWIHLKSMHPKHASLACGICLQLSFSWEQLKQHIKLEHNPSKLTLAEIRQYFCIICLRQYDSKKKLLSHIYVHDFLVDAYKKGGVYFDPEYFIKMNFGAVIIDQDGGNCDKNDVESLVSDRNLSKIKNNNRFNDILYNQLIMDENIEQDIEEISLNGDYDDIPDIEQPQTKVEESDSNIQKAPRNYTLTYGCEWCSRTLSSKWERWLHVASAHAPHIETLRCSLPHCDKVFVTETFRTEHEQHHQVQGPVPNSCEVCCKLWNTRVDFYKHMMGVHPHAVPLVCGVCLKIFPTVPNLYDHVQGSHLPLQGDFVCNICGRNYSNKSKMVRHRRIHGVNESGMFIPNFMQPGVQRRIPRRIKTNEGLKSAKYSNNESPSPSITDTKNLDNNLRSSGDNSNQSLHESDSENDNFETYSSVSYPPQKIESSSLFTTRNDNFQQCKECPKLTFTNYDEFSTHRRIAHQTFHCDLCIKSYGRNSHLWKHVNRCHKGNKLITCQLCFKTSASKYHLQQHFNKIHALKTTDRFKFNNSPQSLESFLDKKFDGYSFESVKQSFLRQELLEKEQQKYQTDLTKFSDQLLETKLEIYPKEPPQEIDINSELYTSIITNYNPPTVTGPYKCLKCNKGFTKRYLLKKHKKNCRPRLQKDLLTRCKSCERIFKDRQSLQKHLANYHSEFKCHLCMLTFPSKCEIISHIRFTHPNHTDFVCECGQILRSKDDLELHKSDHRNSHICQFCGDSLLTKMKLKMHILSLHRKILSLSCGICLKLFATQHVLRDHVKLVHFRDTKFGNCCPVCGKKYGSKWKCFDHINKSHGKIFKPCKICLSVFENELQLRDHFCAVHLGAGGIPNIIPQPIEEKVPTNDNFQSSENEDDDQSDESLNLPSIPKITIASNKSQPDNYSIINKSDWISQFTDITSTPKTSNQTKRTVYENSDAPSMCEICLKTWPAKKHLWQHYIRCHKREAATICGICLKTHSTYLDLRKHLHEKHPNLLHGRGFSSNFICKICGRYHNASSKLKLHMAIHVNYDLTDDYDYNEIKQELKEHHPQNDPQQSSDSEIEEEEFKPTPQHKESDIETDSVFLGFSLQQRKNSENYCRNYSSLLDCFQIMETSPPKNLISDFDESDIDLIKSEDNSDCDSEDERRKLLLKMSPISIKTSHSVDNLNDDPTRDYSDFDDELQIDERRPNDDDEEGEQQSSSEPPHQHDEEERALSKLTNDSELSNSYYDDGTATFKDEDDDDDDDESSESTADEKETEKPRFEVDPTNNIIVLKYDDGREVRYENLNMEYEIVNEDEEGFREGGEEHNNDDDDNGEIQYEEVYENKNYNVNHDHDETSVIENAIKSINSSSDVDVTNHSEHAYDDYEHTEVVEHSHDGEENNVHDLMLEEEVVTEDFTQSAPFSY